MAVCDFPFRRHIIEGTSRVSSADPRNFRAQLLPATPTPVTPSQTLLYPMTATTFFVPVSYIPQTVIDLTGLSCHLLTSRCLMQDKE